MNEYLDFDLAIERSREGFVARVFNSPAGQATGHFFLPFSTDELESFLQQCGRSRRTVRGGSSALARVQTFGGRLFDSVFDGDLGTCLQRSLHEANRQRRGLRIRLRLNGAPDLADVPWEFLYNAALNQFFCLSKLSPLVRYLELPQTIQPMAVEPPLRILLTVANPAGSDRLDTEDEVRKMKESLAPLERKGRVTVKRQERPTLAELRRLLREEEFHIFHFVGHGGFDDVKRDGFLVLESDEGGAREVDAQNLGTVLHDHPSLRLAVLNACEGARGSKTDPFAGTAQSLMQQGLPAVIAMQFEVTDEAAICFTREFYSAVAGGLPVDASLAEARKAIRTDVSEIEWATPVLYMRSPDGRVFDVAGAPAPAAQGSAVTATDVAEVPPAIDAFRMPATVDTAVDVTAGVLDAFNPATFEHGAAIHCVVVVPEQIADGQTAPLLQHVRRAWEYFGPQISAAANEYRAASRLPPIPPPDGPAPDLVLAELAVSPAFDSEASLERAVEALCKAELAVFDLTRFEPGVLFLLGVRAVARRGVTLSSVGGNHTIGAELAVPFNLQLLNLSAHSESQERSGEGLRPWELLGSKIANGYRELATLPHYLDLPAYESVRQLGVESAAYRPTQYTEKVLVLCPFSQEYSDRNWRRFIATELPGALAQRLRKAGRRVERPPRLERLLDVKTPRLVAQTLFESIRLTEMCLIDWTDLRANVMFEAGVRHATNPLGAVHIVEVGDQGQPRITGELNHVEGMVRLFSPVGYRCRPGDIGSYGEMIARFESALAANREGRTGFVYRAVGEALDHRSNPVAAPLAEDLLRSANLLESDDHESTGISTILYHEVNKALVTEARVAAAERRLAAWLFISRYDSPEQIGRDARRREQFELLSLQTRRWARRAGKPELVTEIATCLRAVRAAAIDRAGATSFNAEEEIARLSSRVKLHKEEAKDLREAGDLAGAVETLSEAVTMLTNSPLEATLLSARSAAEPEKTLAAHLADCLGMIGGNCRRMNRLEDALASFERGRPYEEADHLELTSSYNLVNAITLPLEMGTMTVAGQKTALTRAVAAIDRQVRGGRRNDRWAWADLGQCQLLLGDLGAAATSYQRVRALGDQETLASVTSVLQRLAIAIEAAEPAAAASLREGIAVILT